MTSEPKYDGPGYYEIAQWGSPSFIAYVRPCVYRRAGYPDEPGLELFASEGQEAGLQLPRRTVERGVVRKLGR
ncbi:MULTISPECIES: hypothetical protein [unclassified Chelatococcus]|uniref:hypothetical protein n=1 Tax=unclassified Chelatococcus TaxID=2638111 RepID=UPI001BCFC476|nr:MULTISPECIES: hypothetical protein [unclassified Chelatococcus]CAH1662862.1 conserved hypothetical protein [Hyphomicrobiales bacterium]MBS7741491.1 hypothetical protein [Chelatococcus sp. HY11]MBX3544490.1 hypothetical protein [Chelatococcus sp.]MCO5078987.1 hypothetical protein [Chelatococcus sp.]CAH1682499.1 conserved hypothetical protein [Hyphomicrobiales bacterium]